MAKVQLPPVRVEQQLKDQLGQIAAKDDRTLTYVIRQALNDFIKKHTSKEQQS
jgi:predicted transcriptional regulator